MGKNITFTFLFITLIPLVGNASYMTIKYKELGLLKNKLSERENTISKLNEKITGIEDKLNMKNKKYLNVIRKKNELEEQLYAFQVEVSLLEEEIQKARQKARNLLRQMLVHSLEKQQNIKGLVKDRIWEEQTKEKITLIQKQVDKVEDLKSRLKLTKEQFDSHNRDERKILESLDLLEEQKKLTARKFVKNLENRDELYQKYSKLKKDYLHAREQYGKKQKISMEFTSPLDQFDSFDFGNKGITYKFKGNPNVLATHDGKIVYSGELASYGNIVMIDHGSGTRSIILGDFNPNVEKGKLVAKGDLLGKTSKTKENGLGSVYFEVREDNNIQNTILLMNKKLLAKSNHRERI